MKAILTTILLCFVAWQAHSQEPLQPKFRQVVDVSKESKPLHLYLLVGQSNMAGNSPVEPEDTLAHPRILRLNQAGEWEIAKDPLRYDKAIVGMGPGMSFARYLADQDTGVLIGLIPAAVGGTSINLWQPGAYDSVTHLYPYDRALAMTNIALQSGILKGIIWNQGESDSKPGREVGYEAKLEAVVRQFRNDLAMRELPFVAGLLPDFQLVKEKSGVKTRNESAIEINRAIRHLKKQLRHYQVVSLKNATDKGDGLHLDSRSAREMGVKYAKAIRRM